MTQGNVGVRFLSSGFTALLASALLASALLVETPTSRDAQAQGAPPQSTALPATPAEAWAAIRSAYAAAPTAERVTVTVAGTDGASKGAEHFDLKLDPRPGNSAGPRLRLDLGPVRLVAGDARVAAVHELSREGAFVVNGLVGPLGTSTLASLLPPLPLTALAALTGGETPPDAAGYVRPVEWTEVGPGVPPGGGFTVTGHASGARVRVAASAGGRLRSLTILDLPGGGSITAEFAPLPPPSPSDFDLGVDAWPRVATIRDLFALPPTPVEPGEPVPQLAVQTPKGEPVILNEALAKVVPAKSVRPDGSTEVEIDPPAPERVVLIIHRLPPDPAGCDVPSPALAAARAALAELLTRSERDRFLARAGTPVPTDGARLPAISGAVVLVADLAEGNSPDRLRRGQRMLDGPALPTPYTQFAPQVFQSASANAVIGPFARATEPGETLVVTLTRSWRLIKAEPWPAGTTGAQGAALIEQRVRAP
jgi:hypothetical protein